MICCVHGANKVSTECVGNNKNNNNKNNKENNNKGGVDYYNSIKMPNYYDIHFAKRIELDVDMTKKYHSHLISLGYEKTRTYEGKFQWKKTK